MRWGAAVAELRVILRDALAQVAEDLCFLIPDAAKGDPPPVTAFARVEFAGPSTGLLEIRVAGDVLSAVVQNMLGDDGPQTEEALCDGLTELANVVCGTFLPLAAGDDAEFDLTPRLTRTKVPGGELPPPATDEAVLHVDGGCIRANVVMTRGTLAAGL